MKRLPHWPSLPSACLVALLCGTLLGHAGAQPTAMKLIQDPDGRFTINLPADWEVQTHPGEPGAPVLEANAPGKAHSFPNVNIVIDDHPFPPAEWARVAGPALRASFRDFTVIQEGPTQIGGYAAYYRYFTWRAGTGEFLLYQVQVYLTTPKNGFIIAGAVASDPASLQAELPVIVQILNSLQPIVK